MRKRKLRTEEVQLGDLPPIVVAGGHGADRLSRRSVAGRWIFGLATTMATASLLMVGALLATVERVDVPASALRRVPATDPESRRVASEKGDLAAAVETASQGIHQSTLSVPVVRRGDNRQTVATRPYRFVSSPLPAARSALSADIPEYNLAKTISVLPPTPSVSDALYSGAASDFTVEIRPFPVDDAVSFAFPEENDAEVLSDETGLSTLHLESADAGPSSTSQDVAMDEWPESLLDGPARPPNVTVLDANITALQKSADGATAEKNVFIDLVQPGDTLEEILLGSGIDAQEAQAVELLLDRAVGRKGIGEGDVVELHFAVSTEGDDVGRQLERFTAYRGEGPLVSVGRTDAEGFAIAEPHRETPPDVAKPAPAQGDGGRPSLYEAVFQAASDAGLPDSFIGELVRAFAFEVDLTTPARVSDRIDLVFMQDVDGTAGEVLYASLTVESLEYRMYRFRDINDDETRLYDGRGRSASRRLLRKPVSRGEFRSGFGMRNHPILKRRRMHTGVDWAALRGTPIYAAGNATVMSAGWQSGYGRAVRLDIGNGFESFYAHMSKIAPGLKRGDAVRQGDIIGYVGTSGLSTGNHLHYELSINGRRVDPLRVRIPHQRELTGSAFRDFQQERDRIDSLVKAAHSDAHYAET